MIILRANSMYYTLIMNGLILIKNYVDLLRMDQDQIDRIQMVKDLSIGHFIDINPGWKMCSSIKI